MLFESYHSLINIFNSGLKQYYILKISDNLKLIFYYYFHCDMNPAVHNMSKLDV